MKIKVTKTVYEKVEKPGTEYELPGETTYWFETGIRRAIKIEPIWTTWQKERQGKEEEIWKYEFTCVYLSFECKAEKFSYSIEELIRQYEYNEKNQIVKYFIDNELSERSQHQFETDLETFLKKIK